MLDINILY